MNGYYVIRRRRLGVVAAELAHRLVERRDGRGARLVDCVLQLRIVGRGDAAVARIGGSRIGIVGLVAVAVAIRLVFVEGVMPSVKEAVFVLLGVVAVTVAALDIEAVGVGRRGIRVNIAVVDCLEAGIVAVIVAAVAVSCPLLVAAVVGRRRGSRRNRSRRRRR